MISRRRGYKALAFYLLLLLTPVLRAQERESALSDREIEKLRETAYIPPDRVLAFLSFLDDRTGDIQKLSTGPRRPGREEDLHERFSQVNSILDELNDNLDDYGPRHRDLRKVLPKLLSATERWGMILRTPPENDAYAVSRKLALESLRDLREEATKLIEEQKIWFAAHPPPKETDGRGAGR